MTARSARADRIEREIAERITAAKLRLRFDRVVLGLAGRLKAALAGVIADDEAVIVTVTAPIKLPAKTAVALQRLVSQGVAEGECRKTIHGNRVRVRRLTGLAQGRPKLFCFVHNPEADAGLILDLAEARLRERA